MKKSSVQELPSKKKIGFGSVSLILVILALVWSYSFLGFCLGDVILNALNLPAWSNESLRGTSGITISILPYDSTLGIHYTAFYSLLLFIPALILALKYKSDRFASAGKWLSLLFIALLLLSPVLYLI